MNYFIIVNGVQQGPFTLDELRMHNIASDTLVWAEGMAQWTPAWQVEELKPLFYGKPSNQGPVPPPPPPPGYGNESQPTGDEQPMPSPKAVDPQKKSGRWWSWPLIILVALLVIMGITNPAKEHHRAVIKEQIAQGLDKAMQETGNDVFSQGMGMLVYILSAPIIDKTLDTMLQYHNYIFFSTTSIPYPQGGTTTSYGVFGKVFTVGREKIASAISSEMNEGKTEQAQPYNRWLRQGESQPSPDADEAESTHEEDTTSLQRQIGNAIIDHVGQRVKKEINENTDSATSQGINELVEDVIRLFKGL